MFGVHVQGRMFIGKQGRPKTQLGPMIPVVHVNFAPEMLTRPNEMSQTDACEQRWGVG